LSALFIAAGLSAVYAQDSGIKFNVGAGVSLLANTFDQQFDSVTNQGQPTSVDMTYGSSSFGFNGFADITQYFTVNFGYRVAIGSFTTTGTATGATVTGITPSQSNTVSQFELGGEFKYPIIVNTKFSWAPKIGLDYVGFLSGAIGGYNLSASADAKQQFSPIYVTLGADLNFNVTKEWFVRVPVDIGFGLNAKLSSKYYGTDTYTGSSSIGLRAGLEVGYALQS
jgi:hypothetical protein